MKFLFLAILPLTLVVGCRKDDEFPKSVETDLEILPSQVFTPSECPMQFASRLCAKIASLSNINARVGCQKAWEDRLYQISVDSSDLRVRYRQFGSFCDIAGVASACVLKSGGTDEDYWKSRLKQLKWMQNQLSRLEPPTDIAPDDHRPRTQHELMRDSYWEMFHDAFNVRVRRMEKSFNDVTCGRISPDRQQKIRQEFERVLGRKIRTNEEIWEQLRAERKAQREKLGLERPNEQPVLFDGDDP